MPFVYLAHSLDHHRLLGGPAPGFKHGSICVTALLAEASILWEPTQEAEALAAQKTALNV